METRQVTIDDVTNMVYETALTFKGSTFGPVDFNRKFYGKFKCDVDHMIMALGNLKNCYNTETLLLLYGKNLITKKGKRQYSVEWLPTYEPSHYPRAEIEPENADYDIEIVEVKKILPLDVSVAKPGSNELIDRSNSLSIPTSASSEKNRLDEITEAEVVKNSAVLENTIKTPTSISLQAPHDDVAKAKDAPSKLSHCVLNIAPLHTAEVSENYNVVPKPSESLMNKTAMKNNIPKIAVAVSDTPILKEVPRKVPNDESAKKKKKALAKLSESYLNIKNARDVNTPGDVGVIREITIPEDMRYKSAPISHYKNAVVPPVTRERMIAKPSPSSTPLDRVEATRSRSSQKNRAPAGSRQMMGLCPLVPVKHVPYHGPKRFEVTDPRLVLAKIEELLLNEQEDFVSADLLSCVYKKECRSQLLDDCKKAFKVSGYEALDSVPAFRGKIAIEVNMGIVFFRLLRRDFHERSSSRVRSPRRRRITPESSASSSSHEDWRGRRSHDRRHGRHSPDRRRHHRSPDRRSDSHLRSPRRSRYSTDSRSRSSRRQIYHSRRDLDNRRRTRSPARRSKSRSRRTSRSRSRSVRRYERSFVNTRSSSSRSSSPSPKIHNSSYSSEDSSRSLTHGEKADELKKRILDMFPNPSPISRRQAHVEIKPITFAAMQGQRL